MLICYKKQALKVQLGRIFPIFAVTNKQRRICLCQLKTKLRTRTLRPTTRSLSPVPRNKCHPFGIPNEMIARHPQKSAALLF